MRVFAALVLCALLCAPLAAQDSEGALPSADGATQSESGAVSVVGTEAKSADAKSNLIIPKLMPVAIEVLAPLGSKSSKTGDTFPISLYQPIVVDGVEVVPAGTMGMGEVVWAKKSGGMGAAGELVVTARYLDVAGRQLKLRSMEFAQAGKSKIDLVNRINVASAASGLPVSVIGFFINGKQVNLAEGTLAQAKTAEDFQVARPGRTDEVKREEPAPQTSAPRQDESTVATGPESRDTGQPATDKSLEEGKTQ